MSDRPFTFDRVVRLLIGVAIVVALLWIIDLLKDVLLPFLVACLIAYLLEPIVQFNRKLLRLKGRIVAILITLFEATLIIGLLGYIFVPQIIEESHRMAALIHRYSSSDITLDSLPPQVHEILKRNIDFEAIARRMMEENADTLLKKFVDLLHGGLNVILGLIGWLIVLIYVIFIMLDYDRLMVGFKLMVPPRFRGIVYKVGGDIKDSMNHYFRGQALMAVCAALIYCVGFSIVGLPLGILIGVCAGILYMIPYCQYITILPVTLLCLVCASNGNVDFWVMWGECMAVYVVVQIVGDLILTPRIMGKVMGLNPAIILLSLSIWGSLLGIIGMIIALPLTTLLLSYYEQYVIKRSKQLSAAERDKEVGELKDMTRV